MTPTDRTLGMALNSGERATATATAELGSMVIFIRSHTSLIAATISSSVTVITADTLLLTRGPS